MKTTAWRWLVLLAIPGCLLVQPLDDAKPAAGGSAGNGNSSGKPSMAGSGNAGAGPNNGGSGPLGGSGNKAGSGPVPAGGAPSGGAFSLFTGVWTVSGGKVTTTCEGYEPVTDDATTGGQDKVGLGTISDLVFGPGSDCEILADVDDHTASLSLETLPCSYSDTEYDYLTTWDSFEFVVSSDGQSANASLTASVVSIDADLNVQNCQVDQTLDYKR